MLLPVQVSQAQLPSLGDGVDLSPGAERRLGDRIIRELYRDPDYLDDPVVIEYVVGIWQPLLQAARKRGDLPPELDDRFSWEILLGRDRSVNAFALPGGYLGLHLGLVAVVTSRDELASVLAHELSHVTQRHISRLMSKQDSLSPWVLASMVLASVAASKNPELAKAVIVGSQAAASQSQINFTRDMEMEADRVGFGVMGQAGFDQHGFVSMFEKLDQANRLTDNGSYPYLRSHPLTSARISDMRARMPIDSHGATAAPPQLAHSMVAARARSLAYPTADQLRAWAAEPGAGGFAGRPPAQRAAALYAAAAAQARLRDFARATATAAQLRALAGSDAAAARQARILSAEIAMAAGDLPGAQELLEASARPLPRPERLLLTQVHLRAGRASQAVDLMQPWVADAPHDATAWTLLSSAYEAQGQTLRAIRASGEAQMAHLDYAGAVDRFKAARALASKGSLAASDHVEASIIDTRLRQAEQLLREQALER
ncbi:MAG: M48 family metalloprotease [Burkholderiaceae bacterium]|nr:M48 family metalloprotease [Burkholderiaceae bacterium]